MEEKNVYQKVEELTASIEEDIKVFLPLILNLSKSDVNFTVHKLEAIKTITSDLVYRLK